MPNIDIHFRPNDEDRRILDAIRKYLSKLTMQPVFDTAAVRYAIRFWEENYIEVGETVVGEITFTEKDVLSQDALDKLSNMRTKDNV